MKKAVIDIGTNTAHLIIAELDDSGTLSNIYNQRHYVYLAEQGIELICPNAIDRLFKALDDFKKSINVYLITSITVVATEAMRKAKNGQEILSKIKSHYHWTPNLITGLNEAQYIYQGVAAAVDLSQGQYLIVDIGGGSVEFILVMDGNIQQIKSVPIGIANLYNQFHRSEPISIVDVQSIEEHLMRQLNFLDPIKNSAINLIGSAGTFEIFSDKLMEQNSVTVDFITRDRFYSIFDLILPCNLQERNSLPFLPIERAKYIVVALLLIDHLIKRFNLKHIIVSKYALKEGILLSN
jgi:exopolyphosphatase / guanosine-5'-triphosphate,3'-diphosphate pyrophosphatase